MVEFERVTNKDGKLLWQESYIFRRLYRVGDELCRGGYWYRVISVKRDHEIVHVVLEEIHEPTIG
jgi:hypothetical protein